MSASKKTEGGDSWYLSDISPTDKPWDIHRTQSDELARIYQIGRAVQQECRDLHSFPTRRSSDLSKKTEGGDSWYLSDISPTDKPWDIHGTQSDELARIYQTIGYSRYSERIGDCSEWLTYAMQSNDDGQVKLKLREARFCRVRHCPVCQWRRSLMWRARFIKALPEIQKAFPTGRWIFVTLTVKNCELTNLRATLTWMNAAWKRLSLRKEFPALGFMKSVEVTRKPEDGTAHPHFHCLMLVRGGYFKRGYV